MARPRYRLKAQDFADARGYIERARARGDVSSVAGYQSFKAAEDAEHLQAWCDDYLSEEVWKKLLITLRQARKRSKDYKKFRGKRLRHIDVNYVAYGALERVIEDMGKGTTYSKAIERMEECYWEMKEHEVQDAPAAVVTPKRTQRKKKTR